ncbi:MAG: tetratricopeptide repeat protein [Candidatus Kapaibacterium sp.]|jgi:signal transduction histidine kinase
MLLEIVTDGNVPEEQIQSLLEGTTTDHQRVDVLNAEARKIRTAQPHEALALSLRAKELASSITYPDGVAEALSTSGRTRVLLAQYEEALEELHRAYAHYEERNDNPGIASLCMTIAGTLFRLTQHDRALEYLSRALLIFEEQNDKRGMAGALSNMATTYQIVGRNDLALEHLLRALDVQEEIQDRTGIAITANNIGGLYGRLGHNETALTYVMQALAWFRETNSELDVSKCLCNVGDLLAQEGRYDEAIDYHAEALRKARVLNDQQNLISTILSVGRVHAMQDDVATGLSYFATALRLSRDINDRHNELESLRRIGVMYHRRADADRALQYFEAARDLAATMGAKDDEAEVSEMLSRCYESMHEYDRALEAFKQAVQLRSEILAQEKEKLVSVMEVRFNVERAARDREIYRLRNVELADAIASLQENSDMLSAAYMDIEQQQKVTNSINLELEKANAMLHELNREKNDLLGVVSHDIKNFIAGIKLSAESMRLHQKTRDDAILQKAAERIIAGANDISHLIASLLDNNALETGKLSFSFEKVNVTELCADLLDAYRPNLESKRLRVTAVADFDYYARADRMRLKASLDNLVSNAVKYSPVGRQISIMLSQSGGMVRVEVSDEGAGFTEEDKKLLFQKFARLSARPTAGESSTGLGLSITKKIVDHMGGSISLQSEPGKGSTFTLDIPVWIEEAK